MLSNWLSYIDRENSDYEFAVVDVAERMSPGAEVMEHLAQQLLIAHIDPQMLREDCLQAVCSLGLDDIREYVEGRIENEVFPDKDRVSTRVGNFGEVLAAYLLTTFEDFWLPIYKLRFREKRNWAMRLTDLCLVKKDSVDKPLVCYGEVKTRSARCDLKLGVKAYCGLVRDDALSNPEILNFVCHRLYDRNMYEEWKFLSRIRRDEVDYDRRHDLFLVHAAHSWDERILDNLRDCEPEGLLDPSVKVVLIADLRQLIDEAYALSPALAVERVMDRQRCWSHIYRWLDELVEDPAFKNNMAQARACAMQEDVLKKRPVTQFRFDSKQIWRYCDYIFSESSLLLREGFGDRDSLTDWAKMSAEGFEFLAKCASADERGFLLLSSATCYYAAGYQANTQCLAKMLREDHSDEGSREAEEQNPDAVLTKLFRKALVTFLERDIPSLQGLTAQSLSEVYDLQESVVRNIVDQESSESEVLGLTAHAYYQQALSDIADYCLDGNHQLLSSSYENVEKSHKYFQEIGDSRLGTITSELRTILSLFDERSTWTNIADHAAELLNDPIWQRYLEYLAYEKGIVEFWPSQLKAVQGGALTSGESLVLQMPTSAGKTLVAELCMLAALTQDSQARCLYIAPYRALVNEIRQNLSETLGAVGYRVSDLMGGFELSAFEDFLSTESDVLVATPEKVELFLRAHPEYFQPVSVVVIDEGHILDEGVPSPSDLKSSNSIKEELEQQFGLGRGALLELLITRLHQKLPDTRFIFLSAVMPEVNAADFVEWLSCEGKEPLRIDRSERPARQLIAKFEWRSSENGELEYMNLPRLPSGRRPFVPHLLQRQRYLTGKETPTGRPQRRSWPDTKSKVQTAAMLATRFAKTGPVLVFCAQPQDVRRVVDNLITSLEYLEASDKLLNRSLRYVDEPDLESFYLALQWLGEDHYLTRALHYGVGLHYGPLPDPVRQAVEDEFKSGQLQILVSTNTLGQGVNLPIKTAVIYSLERRWGEGEENSEKIRKRDFWNICGRAGRAGEETEGQVVFIVNSQRDRRLLREYYDQANLEKVTSALYKLLLHLVEERISEDELIGYFDSHILALIAEEVVDTQDEEAIHKFLERSLVGVQALRDELDLAPLVSAIKKASVWVTKEVPDSDLRQVFSTTGLSVRSCQSLEQAVDRFVEGLNEEDLERQQHRLQCDQVLLQAAFEACEDLPEMKASRRIMVPDDEFEVVQRWIAGEAVEDLRLAQWEGAASESFSEYVADRIVYRLPWGFNGFLHILAHKLQKHYEDLPLSWQHLPSMTKYGVDSVYACWASSLGISSRGLALQLADLYHPDDRISFYHFTKWMVGLSTDFIMHELKGFDFEKRRLIDSINGIVPDQEYREFLRNSYRQLTSPVKGIPYENRSDVASKVKEGDRLSLEPEPENENDPHAVKVLFNRHPIGYVDRDIAKLISREMEIGRQPQVYARRVKPATQDHPSPWIEMSIALQ